VLAFRVIRFALAAALLLVLASCGKSRPRADLVFINGAEPESIDPAIVTDQVGMRIASALFEGLCRIDEAGKPQPGMAERWDMSPGSQDLHLSSAPERDLERWRAVHDAGLRLFLARVLDPEFGADYASQFYVIKNARAFS
jgi:oligopeptide transport system substrate-binding protein